MSTKKNKKLSDVIKSASIVSMIAAGILVLLLLVLLFKMIPFGRNYYKIESRIDNIQTTRNSDTKNYETVGWLRVQGTTIDYPIIWSPDDSYDYPVQLEKYVWTFETDNKYHNKINIMGHNILNLSSHPIRESENFNRLEPIMAFVYDDFAEKNKYIQLSMDGREYLYKIFSAGFIYATDIGLLPMGDNTKEEMLSQIKMFRESSLYDYDVDVNEDDDMVSIITCTRFFEGKKNINFQITGRRVRTEEKINNYKVTKNKNYKEVEEILEKGDEKNEDSSV